MMQVTGMVPTVATRRFEGKVAVVTGGSSGIGLATARRLHDEGARVAICARQEDRLRAAALSIGPDVTAVSADLTKPGDIERLFRVVLHDLGRVDVLFVNAGFCRFASLAHTSEDVYDALFAANTKSAYFTIQRALPALNDGASIVVTALAPVSPTWRRPGTGAYAASKFALLSVVQTAAAELAGRAIRVNAVSPGTIRTPIFESAGLPPEAIGERLERIAATVPLGRLGRPEEIASVVAFLASADASYVTGQEVRVNGGLD